VKLSHYFFNEREQLYGHPQRMRRVATRPSQAYCDGRIATSDHDRARGDCQIMITTTTLLYVEGIRIIFYLL
jgi:hypothetical protein